MVIENAEFVSSDESSGDEEEEQVKMGTVRVAWYPIGTEEVGLISCRLSIILPALNSFLQFLYGSFFLQVVQEKKINLADRYGTALHFHQLFGSEFSDKYYPEPIFLKLLS